MSMNELPTREALTRAIGRWFVGGGTAVLLTNTLRREEATLLEAKAVAKECGVIADKGYHITEDVVVRTLWDLRSSINRNGSIEQRTVTKSWDGERCVFNDQPCPECGAWDPVPVVHGRLLTSEEMLAGLGEIRQLLAAWAEKP